MTLQIAVFVGIGKEEAGLGAGLTNTSQESGGALGLAVIATIRYSGFGREVGVAGGSPVAARVV